MTIYLPRETEIVSKKATAVARTSS